MIFVKVTAAGCQFFYSSEYFLKILPIDMFLIFLKTIISRKPPKTTAKMFKIIQHVTTCPALTLMKNILALATEFNVSVKIYLHYI